MVKIKSLDAIGKAYKDGATRAPQAFAEAVKTTSGVIEAAKASEDLYAQKVQEAIANRSRVKGLEKVTDEDWRKAALDKGVARIGAGMQAAVEDQKKGYAPYHAALSGLSLPARTADGMANLTNRAGAVVKTMIDTKKSQG